MNFFAGLDVGDKLKAVCTVDESGKTFCFNISKILVRQDTASNWFHSFALSRARLR